MKELLEGLQIDSKQRRHQAAEGAASKVRWRRRLVIGAAIVAAVAVGAWRAVDSRAVAVQVITVAASADARRPFPSLTAGGYVRAAKVVYVVPRVSGRIAALHVAEGDEVKAGDVLARIDSRDLEQEAAEARANVELAQANLTKLQAGSRPEEVAEARARVQAIVAATERAKRELARSKALFEAGFVSAQALDQASTEIEVGESNLTAARQSLSLVEAGPRKEELQIAEASLAAARARCTAASNRLSYATIQAPVSGRVLRKFCDVGDFVSPGVPYIEGYDTLAAGSPVVLLADLGKQEVAADINETDIGKVRLRQAVEVSPNAYPGEVIHGEVTRIAPRADKNKNTIEVKATIERSSRVLPYDMSVKLTFLEEEFLERGPAGARIPASAVIEKDGKRFVFVVSNSHAALRPIEFGARDQETIVVTGGLDDGDQVVVSNLNKVRDGKRVEIR